MMNANLKKMISIVLSMILMLQFAPSVNASSVSLSASAWDGSIAASYQGGTGTETDPYQIADGTQLARVAQEVNNGNELGMHYILTSNINLGNINWTPIGNSQNPFSGTFDGRYYRISNMLVGELENSSESIEELQDQKEAALQRRADSVSDIEISNIVYDGTERAIGTERPADAESRLSMEDSVDKEEKAPLQIQPTYKQDDVKMGEGLAEDDIISAEFSDLEKQAIMQQIESLEAELASGYADIDSENLVNEKQKIISQILTLAAELSAKNVGIGSGTQDSNKLEAIEQNAATIESLASDGLQGTFGSRIQRSASNNYDYAGLFGYFSSGIIEKVVILDSYVSGIQYMGSVVGYSGTDTLIENCYSESGVSGEASGANRIGGIAGFAGGEIAFCYNFGDVSSNGPNRVGGIVGETSGNVKDCVNMGNVDSFVLGFIGGIAGYHISDSNKSILRCYNSADIYGSNGYVGGIVGLQPSNFIINCANAGSVNDTTTGGFQGGLAGKSYSISASCNTGSVSGDMAGGLSAVISGGGGVLQSYNAGQVSGVFGVAGITAWLMSNAILYRNYFLAGTASSAVDINQGYMLSVSVVSDTNLKSPTWGQTNLHSDFIPDTANINSGYPILEPVNYTPAIPEPPTESLFITDSQAYAFASYYLQSLDGGDYEILEEKQILHDENGDVVVFAIPYVDNNEAIAGHVNIGARIDGLSFYIIDPIPENYSSIAEYSGLGHTVMYQAPFRYYIETEPEDTFSTSHSTLTQAAPAGFSFEGSFSEENRVKNLRLLETIEQMESRPGPMRAVDPITGNITHQLTSEASGQMYVKVSNGAVGYHYGGNQDWWRDLTPKQHNIELRITGDWMISKGCGPTAFANVIAYNIGKNSGTFGDLLNYTDENRYQSLFPYIVENPNYAGNFTQTFTYNSTDKSFSQLEYLKFMDFYADLAHVPGSLGMVGGIGVGGTLTEDMIAAFDDLEYFTGHSYILTRPTNSLSSQVETFIADSLDNDTPVLMLITSVLVPHYLDINQPNQNFSAHWMTVTKLFHNVTSGESFVAISSWGKRYSVNTELLKVQQPTTGETHYYPFYYSFDLQ